MDAKLQQVKVIGFDWDGTLVDSLYVKAEAFADSIFNLYDTKDSRITPENHALRPWIRRLYIESCGAPRGEQLRLVQSAFRKFDLPVVSSEQLQSWSDGFTAAYLSRDIALFKGAIETVEALRRVGYRLFLGSSVPQKDLDQTLLRYPEIKHYFDEVLGTRGGLQASFRKGSPYLRYISRLWNVMPSQIAFVGDAPTDVYTTKYAGGVAVAVFDQRIPSRERELKAEEPDVTVRSLPELLEYFSGVA